MKQTSLGTAALVECIEWRAGECLEKRIEVLQNPNVTQLGPPDLVFVKKKKRSFSLFHSKDKQPIDGFYHWVLGIDLEYGVHHILEYFNALLVKQQEESNKWFPIFSSSNQYDIFEFHYVTYNSFHQYDVHIVSNNQERLESANLGVTINRSSIVSSTDIGSSLGFLPYTIYTVDAISKEKASISTTNPKFWIELRICGILRYMARLIGLEGYNAKIYPLNMFDSCMTSFSVMEETVTLMSEKFFRGSIGVTHDQELDPNSLNGEIDSNPEYLKQIDQQKREMDSVDFNILNEIVRPNEEPNDIMTDSKGESIQIQQGLNSHISSDSTNPSQLIPASPSVSTPALNCISAEESFLKCLEPFIHLGFSFGSPYESSPPTLSNNHLLYIPYKYLLLQGHYNLIIRFFFKISHSNPSLVVIVSRTLRHAISNLQSRPDDGWLIMSDKTGCNHNGVSETNLVTLNMHQTLLDLIESKLIILLGPDFLSDQVYHLDLDILLELAKIYLHQLKLEKAFICSFKLYRLYPNNFRVVRVLAKIYSLRGECENAIECLIQNPIYVASHCQDRCGISPYRSTTISKHTESYYMADQHVDYIRSTEEQDFGISVDQDPIAMASQDSLEDDQVGYGVKKMDDASINHSQSIMSFKLKLNRTEKYLYYLFLSMIRISGRKRLFHLVRDMMPKLKYMRSTAYPCPLDIVEEPKVVVKSEEKVHNAILEQEMEDLDRMTMILIHDSDSNECKVDLSAFQAQEREKDKTSQPDRLSYYTNGSYEMIKNVYMILMDDLSLQSNASSAVISMSQAADPSIRRDYPIGVLIDLAIRSERLKNIEIAIKLYQFILTKTWSYPCCRRLFFLLVKVNRPLEVFKALQQIIRHLNLRCPYSRVKANQEKGAGSKERPTALIDWKIQAAISRLIHKNSHEELTKICQKSQKELRKELGVIQATLEWSSRNKGNESL